MPEEYPPIQSASVLLPTFNGMEFLERVFDALVAQEAPFYWDVHVIDSASSDGTLEFLARRAADFPVPMVVRRIASDEFDHGDTRNALAAESTGQLLVFLTQDAIPSHDRWLAQLAANFDDPLVGAAYCRNVHREDSQLLTRVFTRTDPGYDEERVETRITDRAAYDALTSYERRLYCNFNDVASAIRRSLWERYPFPRTMMGEDVLIGRAILEAGYTIVYDADATIDHSHDYGPEKIRWRGQVDARFNAEWLDRISIHSEDDIEEQVDRLVADDLEHLRGMGIAGAELDELEVEARTLRASSVRGMYEGGLSTLRYPESSMRDSGRLELLFVVRGFPPENWGESERHCLELAQALQARGHGVTVLTPSAPVGNEPDFVVREDVFEGVRVLRMTDRRRHRNLRESFTDPRIDAVFAEQLRTLRPDLAHFFHLQHVSAGMVEVARRAGVASVVSDGDVWQHCARAGFLRPDGVLCDQNRGAGCFACLKDRPALIEAFARWDRAARRVAQGGGPLAGLAGGVRRLVDGAVTGGKLDDLEDRREVLARANAAADLRLTPARSLRALHLDPERFDPHQLVYTADGVRDDLGPTRDAESDGGRLRVGFFGSLTADSGVETLLEAVRALAGRARLQVFAGCSPESNPDHARLAAFAEQGTIEFCGLPDRDRLSDLHAQLDVVVVPSAARGVGLMVVHEARRSRTALVVTDAPELAELVRHDVDGLVAKRGDARDLAQQLGRLANDVELRALLAAAGPEPKTLSTQVRELEYRYRALCCVTRSTIPLLHVAVQDGRLEGPTRRLGEGWLLMQPGSRASFSVESLSGGPVTVELEQRVVAGETDVVLGGRLIVDGAPLAHFETLEAGDEDRIVRSTAKVVLPDDARELVLEPYASERGLEHCLRAGRLRVLERPLQRKKRAPSSTASALPAPDLPTICERLRVRPGARVDVHALPRVLVVIPTLEGREVLEECLASVRSLDYPADRLRVVVVENASTDDTAGMVARRFPEVQVLPQARNLGFAAACNAGAELAAGAEVLVFLNNDMRFEPNFLQELVGPVARGECDATSSLVLSWDGSTIDGAGTGSNFLGIAVQPGYGSRPGPEHGVPRETLFPCGGNMAIRTAVFEDVGGFDAEYFAYYEDLDLGWRLWVTGHRVWFVPSAVCYHHHSYTSRRLPTEAVRLAMVRNSLLTCVKNYDDENLHRVFPALVALASKRAMLKAGLDDEGFRIEHAELVRSDDVGDARRAAVDLLGAADWLALDDLLGQWDHWMQRRADVQARRRRSDAEIFRLFLDPFACAEGDESYRALQERMIALYDLERVFAPAFDPTPTDGAASDGS